MSKDYKITKYFTKAPMHQGEIFHFEVVKTVKRQVTAAAVGTPTQILRRQILASGAVIHKAEPTVAAATVENLMQTNVTMVRDRDSKQEFFLKKSPLWQIIIEIIAQEITRFFMPLTPLTRVVRNEIGEYFLLSQAVSDAKELQQFDESDIRSALAVGKFRELFQLAMMRLYLGDIDFNLRNVLCQQDWVVGVDPAFSFFKIFLAQQKSNPAHDEFKQYQNATANRPRRLDVKLKDLQQVLRLDIKDGFEPIAWLWSRKVQMGHSVMRVRRRMAANATAAQTASVTSESHIADQEQFKALLHILITPPTLLDELIDEIFKLFSPLLEATRFNLMKEQIVQPIKEGLKNEYLKFKNMAGQWPEIMAYFKNQSQVQATAFLQQVLTHKVVGENVLFMDEQRRMLINTAYQNLLKENLVDAKADVANVTAIASPATAAGSGAGPGVYTAASAVGAVAHPVINHVPADDVRVNLPGQMGVFHQEVPVSAVSAAVASDAPAPVLDPNPISIAGAAPAPVAAPAPMPAVEAKTAAGNSAGLFQRRAEEESNSFSCSTCCSGCCSCCCESSDSANISTPMTMKRG